MAVKKNNSFREMQNKNLEKVFHVILDRHPVSRVEIASLTGLTKMTVTNCVKWLMDHDLVYETEGEKQPVGRPPIMLELNRRTGVFIGIEVNKISCKLVVTDIAGEILERLIREDMTESPEVFVGKVGEFVRMCREKYGMDYKKFAGIGLALPGNYNATKDQVEYISNMRNWNGFPLHRRLSEALPDTIVEIQNAARAGAKGEIYFGAARREQELAFVHGAMGLSLSLYTNDGIHVGGRGFMARFGHMIVDVNGRKCVCGNRGCLETYASVGSLAGKLYPGARVGESLVERMMTRSRQPDEAFQDVMEEVEDYLAIGISNIVNCFNPRRVCVGGYLGVLLAERLRSLNEKVNALLPEIFRDEQRIFCSSLGEWGSALGNLPTVRERLFRETCERPK